MEKSSIYDHCFIFKDFIGFFPSSIAFCNLAFLLAFQFFKYWNLAFQCFGDLHRESWYTHRSIKTLQQQKAQKGGLLSLLASRQQLPADLRECLVSHSSFFLTLNEYSCSAFLFLNGWKYSQSLEGISYSEMRHICKNDFQECSPLLILL